jgi:hypothetical protein
VGAGFDFGTKVSLWEEKETVAPCQIKVVLVLFLLVSLRGVCGIDFLRDIASSGRKDTNRKRAFDVMMVAVFAGLRRLDRLYDVRLIRVGVECLIRRYPCYYEVLQYFEVLGVVTSGPFL